MVEDDENGATVEAALSGDAAALERLLRAVQPLVSKLALRFFGCPDHAADGTQEVLVQILTHLDRFERRSSFTTWVYRVATNKFLSMARSRAEKASLSFEQFEHDLAEGEPESHLGNHHRGARDLDRELLAAEVRIGCTLAMLLCLGREARMAFILGAVVELDHQVAAEILGCSPATYRKRLERARESITELMRRRCGVFDAANACRCEQRIGTAIARGRLDPAHPVFATAKDQVRRFPAVLAEIRRLEELQRAAAIYQSHPEPAAREDFASRLRVLLGRDVRARLQG